MTATAYTGVSAAGSASVREARRRFDEFAARRSTLADAIAHIEGEGVRWGG